MYMAKKKAQPKKKAKTIRVKTDLSFNDALKVAFATKKKK